MSEVNRTYSEAIQQGDSGLWGTDPSGLDEEFAILRQEEITDSEIIIESVTNVSEEQNGDSN